MFPDNGINLSQLSDKQKQNILGIQANLWTEQIDNDNRLDFMTYPRICALSESAWSDESNKNFDAFLNNLNYFIEYYKNNNINFYDYFNPSNSMEPESAVRKR